MWSRVILPLAGWFVWIGVVPASAQGYQVQPMIATIAPTGSDASLRLSIKNTGAVPINVEFIPFRLAIDAAGMPTRAPEERDLIVFPPQTTVPPGREQSVQVRYIGDGALADARVYGVRVNQVPVQFGQGASSSGAVADVKVGFNFITHIFVSPAKANSVVAANDVVRQPDGSISMQLVNDGNAVTLLSDLTWQVTDATGKTTTLTANEISAGGFGALMPHERRPATVAAKNVTALSGPVKVVTRQP